MIISLSFVHGDISNEITSCDTSLEFESSRQIDYSDPYHEMYDLLERTKCYIAKGDIKNAMIIVKKVRPILGGPSFVVEVVKDLYNKEYKDEALDLCDFLFATYTMQSITAVQILFQDEAFIDNALDLLKAIRVESGRAGLYAYKRLVSLERHKEAELLANKLLEEWVNEDRKSWDHEFSSKLDLSRIINSTYYYNQLLEKYITTVVGLNNVRNGIHAFEFLVDLGRNSEAEKLANKLLEIWINQDSELLIIDINKKFKLAKKIHSSYYYDQLLEKFLDIKKEDKLNPSAVFKKLIEDSDKLKLKRVHSGDNINSIIDMLGSRLYVDNKSSERYEVSLESIQQFTETMLYEASKDNDIVFNILHAIALNVQNDSYFSIYMHDVVRHDFDNTEGRKDGDEGEIFGSYSLSDKTIIIKQNINDSSRFKGTIVHEMVHKLMDILYKNSAKPYRWDNDEAIKAYQKAINQLELKLEEIKKEYNYVSLGFIKTESESYDYAISCLLNVREGYDESDHASEYIVRYPQLIAAGQYHDLKVQELIQPLVDYWDQYIRVDLERYITENGGNSRFMSDSERENIITPLFLDENNRSGLMHKLKMEKELEKEKIAKFLQQIRMDKFKNLIVEDPVNYFFIIKILKEQGDDDMIKELEKLLPISTVWQSIIDKDPIKYFDIIKIFEESGHDDMVGILRKEITTFELLNIISNAFWKWYYEEESVL